MVNSTSTKPDSKDKTGKADAKARGRAEQAAVVSSLQAVLESDEHLLGFARGKIAGGWRGKLNVGPEAFFAPEINVGLTERRIVLQHYQPLTGKPSEIMPHTFPLTDIVGLAFSDIETFGAERACRLVLRLNNDQHFRIRLKGDANFESAQAMAEVFTSLKQSRRNATSPTQSVCPRCHHVLDKPTKFCPYCGNNLSDSPPISQTTETESGSPETGMNTSSITSFLDPDFHIAETTTMSENTDSEKTAQDFPEEPVAASADATREDSDPNTTPGMEAPLDMPPVADHRDAQTTSHTDAIANHDSGTDQKSTSETFPADDSVDEAIAVPPDAGHPSAVPAPEVSLTERDLRDPAPEGEY